jgi:hypothetical protein
MQPDVLSKFCFGLGLTTAVAKGMLFWSVGRFYESSDVTLGNSPVETFEPAIILVTVVALAGIIGTALAFAKGARGQLVYAAFVLNGVALLANPMG